MPGSPFGVRLHAAIRLFDKRAAAAIDVRSSIQLGDRRPDGDTILAARGRRSSRSRRLAPGDPGRASELHSVLGQAKKSIVLDLKKPEAVAIAKALAAKSDALIENFATGVMDRLNLGAEALHAVAPNLIYISASGLGRTGPEFACRRLWDAAAILYDEFVA